MGHVAASSPTSAAENAARSGERIARDGTTPVHLRLENVTLTLPIYLQNNGEHVSWFRTLFAAATVRPVRQLRTILHDINIDLEEGDRVALIGRNGAGKTTLLNLLTGSFKPTVGRISMHGKRQALLNVSLGFNQEATVRENILLRGTAMGVAMAELQEMVPEILDFAGLAGVAQHRLVTLSAGQRMRLGFAISTSVQPDIMLLDEWIGAGDAEFLAKARQRMQDRVGGSRILVLASHSAELLKRVCDRAIVLEEGRIVFDGKLADGLKLYAGRAAAKDGQSHGAMAQAKVGEAGGGETIAPAFTPRGVPKGQGFGLTFSSSIHCLFDNHQQDTNTGLQSYTCLVEVCSGTLVSAWKDLSASFQSRGMVLESGDGSDMPNEFNYVGPGSMRATVKLMLYREKDKRTAPGARGRIHISCVDWPL